ncbi:MAG: DNA mismatch repair protein MutL [bacterium F083]|nr:MAG: DNA mismatch repair protein MutL [bacterium P201]KWW38206.1 MAG: DNA mismatch repair protein MutL [bacterium F083]
MLDVIKLLPDSVANQIAAGEVIQRPASAVKELMENALDAGATQIDLVVKDAGKSMIMVVDNGCGMSETDARMCFERHATSKISKAEDLFAIRTMGFRGEALASIAAIAQVELKTRRKEDEVGVKIVNEGSVVKEQTLVPMQPGTTFTVKNLFFNVPARRNFLKSPQAELRHIVEEFTRVTLMNPEIGFTFNSDGKELYHLYPGNLKQRIMGLFGSNYEEKLLPVRQEAERISIDGYIVKAEFAKKTRGEQYFFVNKRFIKHAYLHHAIENAFMEMIPKDSFPGYFLNIEVDPADIDINIHPTKTEVNFLDVKLVYAILHAAVRKAIGQHNLSPMIDFEESADLNNDFSAAMGMSQPLSFPNIPIDPNYNPFSKTPTHHEGRQYDSYKPERNASPGDWRLLYGERTDLPNETVETVEEKQYRSQYLQVNQSYVVTAVKSGMLVIDQHLAHMRVLFEKYLKELENHSGVSQQELFPQALTLNMNDASLLKEMVPELENLGFVLEQANPTTFMINGTPSDAAGCDAVTLLEQILENAKINRTDLQLDRKLNLAKTMASQLAIKAQTRLSEVEMQNIVDQLFACNVAEVAPNGKKIYVILNMEDLFQ